MLTNADIASMRTVAEHALPSSCVLHGGTLTREMYPAGGTSPTGGWEETFAPMGTVDCRIAPLTGEEREQGGVITSQADWVITIPADTTIETDDRVTTGGVTYEVVAIRDRGDWEITRRLEARRID